MNEELVLLIASVTPEEVLVEQLEEAINIYKVLPEGKEKEDRFKKIGFVSLLISTKMSIGDRSVGDCIKEIDDIKKATEFFKRPGQGN